jgi:ribosomal protein S18 acetylase RimI-like enzyme
MGTTTKLPVTTVAPADAERAVAVIVLAFGGDPATRWTYPDPHDYVTHFPAIVRAFGGGAFAAGTAHRVGQFAGAALWLPPGVHPDDAAMGTTLERSVPAARLREFAAVFERMRSHHPREPHWYLPLIGVDPAHQNQGHGSALLRHALAQCDREGVPAYLESSNPANISLYERHGFVVLDTIQVGSSPSISPMLRTPR